MITIPLVFAQFCEHCRTVCDSRETRGDVCPGCKGNGTLMSLARVLNPDGVKGEITFIFSAGRA